MTYALDLLATGPLDGVRRVRGGRRRGGPYRTAGSCSRPCSTARGVDAPRAGSEEIFGPAIANGVCDGLSASVFPQDLGVALSVVGRPPAAWVRVNEEPAGVESDAPFGGTEASSSDSREQGQVARSFYTDRRTIAIWPAP